MKASRAQYSAEQYSTVENSRIQNTMNARIARTFCLCIKIEPEFCKFFFFVFVTVSVTRATHHFT